MTSPVSLIDFRSILFPKIKDPQTITAIIERTQAWTSGDLFLTKLIYHYLRQYSAQILRAEGADIIDEIVHHKIVKNWRKNDAALRLSQIEQGLHSFKPQDTLLVLYFQILWRGGLDANIQPKLQAEKNHLLQSGLIELKNNRLQVQNQIYATVFNLEWIEQQRPGLTTRTVAMPTFTEAPPARERLSRATPTPKVNAVSAASTLSKLAYFLTTGAVVASGMALFAIATALYFRAPNNLGAMAKPAATEIATEPSTVAPVAPAQTHKALFDKGLEHASNGRWLPMMQQFCSIPPESAYFAPAKNQVEHWVGLYPDSIQQANNTLLTKQNTPCGLIESALHSAN